MALSDYLVPVNARTNICFDCQNACGSCPWTAVNPKTDEIRFEPVPGWTAEKVRLLVGGCGTKKYFTETYHITACPLFKRGKRSPNESDNLELTDEQFTLLLARWKREGELG